MNNVHLHAIKVELDLNTTQRLWCERACAASRVTYNWGLAEWRRWYRWDQIKNKERAGRLLTRWNAKVPTYEGKPTAFGISKLLTAAKKSDLAWLHELGNAYVAREAVAALGTAYASFFRRLKKHKQGDHSECGKSRRGTCSLGMPRFHPRRPDEGFVVNQGTSLKSEPGKLFVPGLGWVKAKGPVGALPNTRFDTKALGRPCTCESQTAKHKPGCLGRLGGWVGDPHVELCGVGIRRWGGRWYAALRLRSNIKQDRPIKQGTRLSVEVGVRFRAVTFDGNKVGTFADTRASIPSAAKQKRAIIKQWATALLEHSPGHQGLVALARGERRNFEDVRVTVDPTLHGDIDAKLAAVGRTHGTERLDKLERRRKLWERRMSRRYKNGIKLSEQSAGWREARAMVSQLHRKIAQLRADRIHFVSRSIVNSAKEELIVRDMNVKQLMQRGTASDKRTRSVLAPAMHQADMAELKRQIEYKAAWLGSSVKESGPDAETKKCAACGAVQEESPDYPSFICKKCGNKDDRDANAARVRYDHGVTAG